MLFMRFEIRSCISETFLVAGMFLKLHERSAGVENKITFVSQTVSTVCTVCPPFVPWDIFTVSATKVKHIYLSEVEKRRNKVSNKVSRATPVNMSCCCLI